MRSIEILLIISIAFIFLVSLVAKLKYNLYFSIILIVLMLSQVLFEGFRWQLVFVFVAAILWIGKVFFRSEFQGFCSGTIIIILYFVGLGALLAFPVFSFVELSGEYQIGTITYELLDTSRKEIFVDSSSSNRRLKIQIWYPVDQVSRNLSPYIQDYSDLLPAIAQKAGIPAFLLDYLKYVQSHSYLDDKISSAQSSYPIILYLTGNDGFRGANTFQIEELASHGFIVVGIDQPGITPYMRFQDGQIIKGLGREKLHEYSQQSIQSHVKSCKINGYNLEGSLNRYFAEDVSSVINKLEEINQTSSEFKGKLALDSIGIFGVSLSAINAAEACRIDSRLQACLLIDAPVSKAVANHGLEQDLMLITREVKDMQAEHKSNGSWNQEYIEQTVHSLEHLYQQSSGSRHIVNIEGAYHVNFTDLPNLSPFLLKILGQIGPRNYQDIFQEVNKHTLNFFEDSLK